MELWGVVMLAAVAGAVLGMLGGGGSMLITPLLVYVAGWPPAEAIPASLATVGLTAAAGAWQHARRGGVALRAGLSWAAASALGALVGGRLAGHVPPRVLMTAFAVAMAAAALAMLREGSDTPKRARTGVIVLAALGTGAFTGLVGAGGGFAVVPGLVLLAGLPMRSAIGTSLFVIALQSSAGLVGHLSHASLDAVRVLLVSAGAVAGSLGGARLAGRLSGARLKKGFALLLGSMIVVVLWREWGPTPGAVSLTALVAFLLGLWVGAGKAAVAEARS